jgi:hypothetical protein
MIDLLETSGFELQQQWLTYHHTKYISLLQTSGFDL